MIAFIISTAREVICAIRWQIIRQSGDQRDEGGLKNGTREDLALRLRTGEKRRDSASPCPYSSHFPDADS